MEMELLLEDHLWSYNTRKELTSFLQSALRGDHAYAHNILTQIFERTSLGYAEKSTRFEKSPPAAHSSKKSGQKW